MQVKSKLAVRGARRGATAELVEGASPQPSLRDGQVIAWPTPAMNRWAMVRRPSGTKRSQVIGLNFRWVTSVIILISFCVCGLGQAQPPSSQPQPHNQQRPPQPAEAPEKKDITPPTMNAPGSDVTTFGPGSSIARDYLRGGIVLGRALLRPTFDIGIESDSNFLTTQVARGSSGLFTVAPGLELELPALRSGFRLSYSPMMRFFKKNISELPSSNLSHRFDGDFSTRLSPLLQLGFRWHGARSTFDTLEFDPAREVFFSQRPFWRHDVAVQADYRVSERSAVGVTVGVNSVGFKGPPSPQDFFFDYTTTIVGLGYSRRVTPRHTLRVGFESGTNASLRAQNALDPRLNDFRLYQPSLTLLSQLTPTMTGQLSVALRLQRFPHAARSFTGPQISLALEKSLSGGAGFGLSALYTTVLSAFNPEQGSAYAVSTGADARLSKRIGPNLFGLIGTDYQRLSFPVPLGDRSSFGGVSLGQFAGSRRSDNLLGARIEVAFRAHALATLTLGYVFHERNSTLLPFAFERSRFKMGVTFGRWMPTRISSRRF